MPGTPETELYLEDLSVGQVFVSREYTLDAQRLKAFAAEFDPQPFHLDEEAARNSVFGDLAASGWHTAAITMRLLVESLPLAHGMIGSGVEVKWPRPTRPGDRLHVRSEITEIVPSRSRPMQARVVLISETLNQNGEVVQELVSRVVAWHAPPAAAS